MRATRRGFLGSLLGGAAVGALARPDEARAGDGAAAPAGESVTVEVNGASRTDRVGEDETALDYVRKRCGLTGAKHGCGHGACGACAIQVGGVPVAACLLPAGHLHGQQVRTVEGFAPLHPVQRAFMAEDALQCGFCTPGFVVEAAAFHDRWRLAHGEATPSHAEVADALAGHICRCGAYPAIYRAVVAACEGRHDGSDPIAPRVDAREKVTGAAKYTTDVYPEGVLEGAILRSPHASAKVTALDLAPALAVPGVRAAVRLIPEAGTVRYFGQELAAVAGDDEAAVRNGLAAIVVGYEVREAVVGIARGLEPGSPMVYEVPKLSAAPAANEGGTLGPKKWEGNVRGPTNSHFFADEKGGDEAILAAQGDPKRHAEGTWRVAVQSHTPMEPRAAVAHWVEGAIRVWSSTQGVHAIPRDVADRYDVPESSVHATAHYVGGGFGSKVGMAQELAAALELSRAAGKPVRVVVDRHEELAVGGNRPAAEMDVALALDAEGGLAGMVSRARNDSGVALGGSVGGLFRLMYQTKARRHEDLDVLTHGPPAKPFRAPGGPPAFFALEGAVDMLAHARGEDPIAVRRRFDESPIRRRLYDKLEQHQIWAARAPADTGRFRRGVGMASAAWPYFVSPNTHVRVDAGRDGFVVRCGVQDMGNGSRSVLRQAVVDALGVPETAVTVIVGDSKDVKGPVSAGSRTTSSVYPAAFVAAQKLGEDLADAARDQLGWKGVSVTSGGLTHAGGTAPWADVLAKVEGTATARRPRDPDGYFLPITVGEVRIGRGLNGSVSAVEVEVDTRLGKVRALRNWVGVGAGQLISPVLARSQIEGGVVQGLSYALYEERVLDPRTGRLLSHDLEHYRVMLLGDAPEIHVEIDEGEPWEHAPWGPIGFAEVCTCAHAGAAANAVFAATGWRPMELPIRPDRVRAGVAS